MHWTLCINISHEIRTLSWANLIQNQEKVNNQPGTLRANLWNKETIYINRSYKNEKDFVTSCRLGNNADVFHDPHG